MSISCTVSEVFIVG